MALITKYVDKDTADTSGNGDVGDKWKYLWQATKAMKIDAGTNHYKIYVKASQDYGTDGTSPNPAESDDADHDGAGGDAGAVIYLDQVPASLSVPNVFEGYHTTPGDGGIVTLDCAYDGANKLENGIWVLVDVPAFAVFKNFDIKNADGVGVNGGATTDNVTLKNVRIRLSGSNGVIGDNTWLFENCMIDNNGTNGTDVDSSTYFISCIIKNNTSVGGITLGATYYNCLVYDNGNGAQVRLGAIAALFGCTIDANDGGASRCIHQDNAAALLIIVNSIIVDAAIGILSDGDFGDGTISRNNLFNGNTDDASAYQAEYDGGDGAPSTGDGVGNLGHVTGVPGFTGTYVPGANAQNAGLDAHFTNAFWASFDGANNPPL